MKYRNQHANWKTGAKYAAIHVDARKYWFKGFCENCGAKNRKLHMGNLSGQYLRIESDWKTLCVPCHHKLDENSYRNIQKPGKSGYIGVVMRRERPVYRTTLSIGRFKVHLGDFKDKEDAYMMRLAAEEQLLNKEEV